MPHQANNLNVEDGNDVIISPPVARTQVSNSNSLGTVFPKVRMPTKTFMPNSENLKILDGCQNEVIWNCRGVKTASCEIRDLCKPYHADLLFLSETKMHN